MKLLGADEHALRARHLRSRECPKPDHLELGKAREHPLKSGDIGQAEVGQIRLAEAFRAVERIFCGRGLLGIEVPAAGDLHQVDVLGEIEGPGIVDDLRARRLGELDFEYVGCVHREGIAAHGLQAVQGPRRVVRPSVTGGVEDRAVPLATVLRGAGGVQVHCAGALPRVDGLVLDHQLACRDLDRALVRPRHDRLRHCVAADAEGRGDAQAGEGPQRAMKTPLFRRTRAKQSSHAILYFPIRCHLSA